MIDHLSIRLITMHLVFRRILIVYRNIANDEVLYVGLNVGWRDAGSVRLIKRMTALYNTTLNQTNLEF